MGNIEVDMRRKFELEKGLEHEVKICVETNRGRLEHGSDVYCTVKSSCPYQVQSDKKLSYCGLARPYQEDK